MKDDNDDFDVAASLPIWYDARSAEFSAMALSSSSSPSLDILMVPYNDRPLILLRVWTYQCVSWCCAPDVLPLPAAPSVPSEGTVLAHPNSFLLSPAKTNEGGSQPKKTPNIKIPPHNTSSLHRLSSAWFIIFAFIKPPTDYHTLICYQYYYYCEVAS